MKKVLLSALFILIISSARSQVTDSVSMGVGVPSYRLDVYYSFANGTVDTVSNANWHVAFSTRNALPPYQVMRSAAIRINEARGVHVAKSPHTWATFDTTGWGGWPQLHDNDSTWDEGAFNRTRNLSNPFDFGWGAYNMTSHDVDGSGVYLVAAPQGSSVLLKKFMIQKLLFDTQWVFTYANLDGSDSTTLTISKNAFANKLFAYHNLSTKSTINREPNSTAWDILFTRYMDKANLNGTDTLYPVTGVLVNPDMIVAEMKGVNKMTVTSPAASGYVTNINTIGYDWKIQPPPGPPAPWGIVDSLAYFVRKGNVAHKLYFTRFDGAATGIIVFNKTMFALTSLNDLSAGERTILLYPNPAHSSVTVEFEGGAESLMSVFDVTGRTIMQGNIKSGQKINVSDLKKGVYFFSLHTSEGTINRRFILE